MSDQHKNTSRADSKSKRDKSKRPGGEERKSWLAPVGGATSEDYRKMQRRVFNARKLSAKATSLDLKLMSQTRQGLPGNLLVVSPDDSLVRDIKVPPRWAGTAFEVPLMRIKIPGVSEGENTQFWNYIYGEVVQIGRYFRNEVPGRPFQPSKDAKNARRLGQRCKALASDVGPYSPPLAETLIYAAEAFTAEAVGWANVTNELKRKRHSQDQATERILFVTTWIHHETGKYHDKEFAALLNLAGLNHIKPETLRTLRARTR